MSNYKPKILIISKNEFLRHRIFINLIALQGDIELSEYIYLINKNIYLGDYDLVVIEVSNINDIKTLRKMRLKNGFTNFLIINNMPVKQKNKFNNFLNNNCSDADIILKSSELLSKHHEYKPDMIIEKDSRKSFAAN